MTSPASTNPDSTPPITAQRWRRIAEVFDVMEALPPAERGAALAQAGATDEALRIAVERMLRVADTPDSLLDASALVCFDALLPDVPAPDTSDDDMPLAGAMIGQFRIIRELGRGGMGVVYLAERADGQFRQRVALKLIKRGMDTDYVLRRFRDERQIHASLTHPNIARLVDGGTTADDRPYFVMEYIEGVRIDQYVRAHAPLLHERLTVFLAVCDAVQYAHQQLVVHRDIKPANILVAANGVPHLLDFGIAGLLDDEGSAPMTTGVRALTPEYASPEQADGARPGTASDVWSLGVVLYELLTGTLPHAFQSRSPADVAAQLRNTEPLPPSSAATRARPIPPWQRKLRGDLDTIVLTALQREPERRYTSVEAFANDLRRYMAGEPVQARPSTLGYRVSKFVQRNRTVAATGTLLLLTLITGMIATAWQARAATRQAELAERRFRDLRTLAHAVLFDYHDAVVNLPGSTPVRARLVTDGLTYLDKLSAELSGDRSLQREMAQAYQRMGDVQGGSMRNNLGNSAGAISSYQKSLALLDALWRTDSTDAATREALSTVLSELGVLRWETGDLTSARSAMQRAQQLLAAQLAARPRDTALRQRMAMRHDYLGQIAFASGDGAAGRAAYTQALAVLDSIDDAGRTTAAIRRSYSVTLQHLAELLADQGDHAGSLLTIRRVLALRLGLAAEDTLNAELQRALAVGYYYEGEALGRLGQYPEAMASYRRDLAISQRLVTLDLGNALYRGDLEYALTRIGDMRVKAGDGSGALRSYTASYDMHLLDVAADSTNLWKRAALIEAQAKIATTHVRLRRRSQALPLLAQTEAFMQVTVVDTTDAAIRSFFAETWAGLAAAHLALRGSGPVTVTASNECRAAARLYARAEALLHDMMRRDQASNSDSVRLTEIVAQRRTAATVCPAP